MKISRSQVASALKSLRTVPASIMLIASFVVTPNHAVAQVAYGNGNPWQQRANSGPDAEVPGWYYNLGVTGLRAELVADRPKALVVRHVFRNTPGTNVVRVGDIITGAGGKAFLNPHRNGYGEALFGGHGPVSEMAQALEDCQGAEGNGQLRLELLRNGSKINVTLQIGKTYGSYTSTYPFSCPKSQKILDELLEYIVSEQDGNGSFGNPVHNTFSTLALLGSGDRKYLPVVEQNLRYIISSIGNGRERGLINWEYMGAAITLSEYYLITKEDWVLPHLRKIHTLIQGSQYMNLSQVDPRVRETHPDEFPTNAQEKVGGWGQNTGFEGYGPISMITAQGALSYALMHRCGIAINKERLTAAYAFLKRGTAANGYLWYMDSRGGGPNNWADMGRTGASGIANFLNPFPTDLTRNQAAIHSNVIGTHPESFPDTHGSPVMGMAYAALAANTNPANFRKLMDSNRWWFTMAQCNDKTFYYQPNRDNAGYGSDARMTASCVVAFIYTFKNKNLVITGRTNTTNPNDPIVSPNSDGLKAEFFDFNSNLSQLPNLTVRTPDIVRIDATINYESTTAQWEGLPASMRDTFASRHTGLIEIKQPGNYTFYLSSDDGSKLWLDGAELIDNDGLHGLREVTGTKFLDVGYHDIRVEFFENGGGAGLMLKWSGPNIAKQIIPASLFFQKVEGNSDGGSIQPTINLARESGAVASQATTGWGGLASRAIDGNTSGFYNEGSVTHSAAISADWWQVDLGADKLISEVILYNRTDGNLGQRLSNYRISIIDSTGFVVKTEDFYTRNGFAGARESWKPGESKGRVVRVQHLGLNRFNDFALSLAEVEVMGASLQGSHNGNVVPSGAKAYYSFDDRNNIGKDNSGNGFNLSPFLVNHTNAGLSQGGAAFSSDFSKLTHPSIQLGSNWTVSAWYEGLDNDGWRTLFRGARHHHVIVNWNQENLGLFFFDHRDSGVNLNREDGVWRMITAVGSKGRVDYYLDGRIVGTVRGFDVDSDVVCIGNYQLGGQRFADTLDEVYLYNRRLTAAEVARLYEGSKPNGTTAKKTVLSKKVTSDIIMPNGQDLSSLKLEVVSADIVRGEYNAEHQSFGSALNATIKYEWTTDFVNWYKADSKESDENGTTVTITTQTNGDKVSVKAKASRTKVSIFIRLAKN